MDIRDTTVDAIVLKVRDYKEYDKLITYFALESGKALAIARGAARPGGSLRSIAQPFCRCRLTLSLSKGSIAYINSAVPTGSFLSLDADLSGIAYCSYIAELADIAMPENRPSAQFFALLLAAFSLIKLDGDHARTARFFEVRLLAELGLLPELGHCSSCSRSLIGGVFCLSAAKGALLCRSCGRDDAAPSLSAGAVQTIRRLAEAPLTKIASIKINAPLMEEIEAALDCFLHYHLEYNSKAKVILRQLLE
jgi:DNA repair protein RecO (recombination protein O)